jgi:hypothetical protein
MAKFGLREPEAVQEIDRDSKPSTVAFDYPAKKRSKERSFERLISRFDSLVDLALGPIGLSSSPDN